MIRGVLVAAFCLILAACQSADAGGAGAGAIPLPAEKAQGTGGQCGGIVGYYCKNTSDYCAMPAGNCQMADGFGTCQPKTEMCTRDYRPVCGCDGRTYGNACTAAGAGVNIDYQGECRS